MRHHDHEEREERREEREEHRPRAKAMELIIAHFNPDELKHMDHIQGKRSHIPGSKIPHYKHMERMIEKYPEIEHEIMRSFDRHASGGSVGEMARDAEKMKHRGRHGDSEMAFIGPNTKRIFDRIVNDMTGNRRENKNPHTGHPEYFGLGKFFGNISHGFNNFGKQATHTLGKVGGALGSGIYNTGKQALGHLEHAAPQILNGGLQGFMEGGPEGALAGAGLGAASGMMSSMNNPNNHDSLSRFAQSGLGQNLQGALPAAYDRYNQGQSWQNNLASTANQATQGLNNPYARGINQGAQAYQANQGDPYKTAAGAVGGFTHGSQHPVGQMMNTAANRYGQGGGMPQSVAEGVHAGGRQMMNNMMGGQWGQAPHQIQQMMRGPRPMGV